MESIDFVVFVVFFREVYLCWRLNNVTSALTFEMLPLKFLVDFFRRALKNFVMFFVTLGGIRKNKSSGTQLYKEVSK